MDLKIFAALATFIPALHEALVGWSCDAHLSLTTFGEFVALFRNGPPGVLLAFHTVHARPVQRNDAR